ncbi:hypothetical protein HPB50_023082 [Hyalomma asiaticum]|uniref:Uncharacterized protein n=1 Tax=Hyalomma asiaticum TaxID=266040 RepID=A0ACB7TP68_HYAAI|nr:hypothetical protein HPB50_023082 [Hyalomma asiaticum]
MRNVLYAVRERAQRRASGADDYTASLWGIVSSSGQLTALSAIRALQHRCCGLDRDRASCHAERKASVELSRQMERRRRRPASYALTGLVLASVGCAAVWARIYDRCELALELHDRFKFPKRDLDKWLCLAYWESRFDTRAYHKGKYDGSGDHGIFQINDKHWCQPHQGHSENVCRMPCYRE